MTTIAQFKTAATNLAGIIREGDVVTKAGIDIGDAGVIRAAADATRDYLPEVRDVPALKELAGDAANGASELGFIAAWGEEAVRQRGLLEIARGFEDEQVAAVRGHLEIMRALGG